MLVIPPNPQAPTVTYRGLTQDLARKLAADDFPKAAAAGYKVKFGASWSYEAGLHCWTVQYERRTEAPWPALAQLATIAIPAAVPADPVKKTMSKPKRLVLTLGLLMVGLLAWSAFPKSSGVAVPAANANPAVQAPAPVVQAPAPVGHFVEFTVHLRTMTSFVAITDDLSTAAFAMDVAGVMDSARRMTVAANVELGWLDNHPSDSCYRQLYTSWRSAFVNYAAAGLHMAAGTTSELTIGGSFLDRGNAAIDLANTEVAEAGANCA